MIGFGEADKGQYYATKKVDSLVGCCILVKTSVIKEFGLLDEKFFYIMRKVIGYTEYQKII